MFTQQMQAQHQFEEMRGGRALELGQPDGRHRPAPTSRAAAMSAPESLPNSSWEPRVAATPRGAAARVARRGRARRRARPSSARCRRSCSRARRARCKASLARVAEGNGFLLHAGDCAESFAEFSADNIRDKLKVILQMSLVLTYSTGVPTVKIGRIAGQFAKPRSCPDREARRHRAAVVPRRHRERLRVRRRGPASRPAAHGARLPPGRGDAQPAARVHQGWLRRPQQRAPVEPRVRREPPRRPALRSARRGDRAARCGSWPRAASTSTPRSQLHEVDFYTSHEALLLGYEEALTRRDSLTGDWYDCSAHLLWVGRPHPPARRRARRVPVGRPEPDRRQGRPRRVGRRSRSSCAAASIPREPGRLTLVSRMGATTSPSHLPPLLRAVTRAGHPVVWACDPMHGNTFVHESGYKTRHFDAVMHEVERSSTCCRAEGVWPGGVHVELTGDNVTECLGGGDEIRGEDLAGDTKPCATPGSTPAKRSTSRSASPSSSAANSSAAPGTRPRGGVPRARPARDRRARPCRAP